MLEGIMMIGPHKKAIAVRKPDGDIVLDVENLPKKWKIAKIPVLRGAYSLIYQMVLSIKALSYAASFYDIEEEDIDKTDEQNEKDKEQPDEKKAETKSSDGELSKTAIFFAVLLSVAITVGLFILLPNFVIGLLKIESAVVNNLLEGVLRIAIFIGYLAAVTLMKDIKRVWMYHGAEHKTKTAMKLRRN